MVLCKFFQQGSCRFGSKCVNEHLDVKQMIKTDVESVIHGKQWPLSTYGPFRDKPSIPNFIEDQSFEEVRMLCYEAKQKNFLNQFHMQFTKGAVEATTKMNALLQMNPEVVDILIKIYDVPSDTSGNGVSIGKSTNNPSNPFGLVGGNSSNQSSIFAKSAANISSLTNSNNTFAASSQGTAGLFATTSAFLPPHQQEQNSILPDTSKPANSIFVGGSNINTQQNASIFGQQQNPSNFFVASTQQPQTTNTTGFFSQNQFLQQPQQNSDIFRQALQPAQPQQGLFAQASQTMQQQQLIQQQQGIFSQATQHAPAGQSLFAQAPQQTQNIFGQALQQQQQQPSSNIFHQNLPSSALHHQADSNIFQQNQPIVGSQQHVQNQQPSAAFQKNSLEEQNQLGQIHQLSQYSSTLYSRLEDLTADEVNAFKADYFLPGKIPFNPPPKELIN